MFGKKPYIYVSVQFMDNQQAYSYRTDDESIKVNDVVIVPTQKGEGYGTVVKVKRYNEKHAPYPPDKTKFVIRVAGHRLGVNITEADKRDMAWCGDEHKVHIDWSGRPAYWIPHARVFKSKMYECGYCRMCYDTPFPICPNCQKQMNGKMTPEERKMQQERYKPVPTATWIEEDHLFADKVYKCSNCGTKYKKPTEYCFNCKCRMTKTKTDPVWVDEMAFYDGDF